MKRVLLASVLGLAALGGRVAGAQQSLGERLGQLASELATEGAATAGPTPNAVANAIDGLLQVLDELDRRHESRALEDLELNHYLSATILITRHARTATDVELDLVWIHERAQRIAREHEHAQFAGWLELEIARHELWSGAPRAAATRLERFQAQATVLTGADFEQLHYLAEIRRKLGDYDAALGALEDLAFRLDSPEARAVLDAAGLAEYRSLLHGERGQIWRWTGLPEHAAKEVALEGEFARAVSSATGRFDTLVIHALHRADLDLLRGEYATVIAELGELRAEAWYVELDAQQRGWLELALGIAQLEWERESAARPRKAEATLAQVAAADGAGRAERVLAEVDLADLMLRDGRFDEARARLLSARSRSLAAADAEGTGSTSYETAQLFAQEARLALACGLPVRELKPRLADTQRGFDGLLEQWATTGIRAGGIGFFGETNRREITSALIRLELAIDPENGPELAFAELLRAEALGSVARREGLSAATLNEVRAELLDDQRGVLFYVPARDRSHLFAFDRHTMLHRELAADHVVERVVASLQSLLSRLPGTDARARETHARALEGTATAVAAALLPDDVRALMSRWDGVTVLGLDLFGAPPFECLPLGEDGELLGQILAVDRAPSLAVGLDLVRRAQGVRVGRAMTLVANLAPSAQALSLGAGVVGAVTLDEGLLEPLTAPFESVRVLINEAARRGVLDDVDPQSTAVLHVLVHGVHDGALERGALLAFAPDGEHDSGLVSCEDIEKLPRMAPLVILSSCGSGRGPRRVGDDSLTHLGGAFLSVGARAVILAPNAVELGTTLELMTLVHEEVVGGASPASALRRARTELVAGRDPLEVFHLAQFTVVGLGHEPVF